MNHNLKDNMKYFLGSLLKVLIIYFVFRHFRPYDANRYIPILALCMIYVIFNIVYNYKSVGQAFIVYIIFIILTLIAFVIAFR